METEEEQHITTLLCMGFPDPDVIRKALRLAKNDINEAVALLTNESPGLGYGYEPMESGPNPGLGSSGEGENSGRTGTGGFDPPPAYHDVVDSEVRETCSFSNHELKQRGEETGLIAACKKEWARPFNWLNLASSVLHALNANCQSRR